VQVRQKPKDHERYKDQIYDVSDRNGPVRRGGRLIKLPAPGSVAQAGSRQPNGLYVTLWVKVHGGTAAAGAERSAFLGQVQPEARKDAETFF
jgi:hypothetical protein